VWSENRHGRVKSRGSLDADHYPNAPDPVFVSDLEGKILQATTRFPAARFRQD